MFYIDIRNILFVLCFVVLEGCISHDNCFRDFSGKIKFISTKKDVAIVIGKHYYDSSDWKFFDTLKIGQNQESYNIHWAEHRPQKTCHNNCPDGDNTFADSISVKILNSTDMKVLKDTIFSFEEYNFIGDDIELPTITLP